jgi:hypothetical protein
VRRLAESALPVKLEPDLSSRTAFHGGDDLLPVLVCTRRDWAHFIVHALNTRRPLESCSPARVRGDSKHHERATKMRQMPVPDGGRFRP